MRNVRVFGFHHVLLLASLAVHASACVDEASPASDGVTLGGFETVGDEVATGDVGDASDASSEEGSAGETGSEPDPCDPWAQDCPDGQKCVPAAIHADDVPTINKCVPVLGAGQPGDACTYDGAFAAIDDCGADSVCWNLATLEGIGTVGTCTAFCAGSARQSTCSAGTTCLIADDPVLLNLCVSGCNPINQDCQLEPHDHLGCYWTGEVFACVQTPTAEPLGEPCAYINDCMPGTTCAPAGELPSCAGEACCTSFCDTRVEVGECSEVPGTQCVPLYAEGMGPFGFEHVGTCRTPG